VIRKLRIMWLGIVTDDRVPELIGGALLAVWYPAITLGSAAALIASGHAPRPWSERLLLGTAYVAVAVRPWVRQRLRLLANSRRADALADERVCQLAIKRHAGLIKLKPYLWTVTPLATERRLLRAIPWQGSDDANVLAGSNPEGEICVAVPMPNVPGGP
jgi:membrane protein implicated in regulation of membrane protease activity